MGADRPDPPEKKPDPPLPPVEGRVTPVRLDGGGTKPHADAGPSVNRPVHTQMERLPGTDAQRNAGDGARNTDHGPNRPLRIVATAALVAHNAGVPMPMDREAPASRDRAIVAKAPDWARNADAAFDARYHFTAPGSTVRPTATESPKALPVDSPATPKPDGTPEEPENAREKEDLTKDGLIEFNKVLEDKEKAEKEAPPADNEAVSGPPDWADRR